MAVETLHRSRLAIMLATAVVLVGCSGPADDVDAAPTGPPTPAPTTPAIVVPTTPAEPEFEPEDVEDLGKLCGTGKVKYSRAAPYQGPAPHPIAVFSKEKGDKEYAARYIPRDDPPGYEPETPEEVALLACLTTVKTGLPVGNCNYQTDNGTKRVRTDGQRFKIELFALATGTRLVNRNFDADFCPPTLITFQGEVPKTMTSTLNDEHLFKMFNGYVSRAVP